MLEYYQVTIFNVKNIVEENSYNYTKNLFTTRVVVQFFKSINHKVGVSFYHQFPIYFSLDIRRPYNKVVNSASLLLA